MKTLNLISLHKSELKKNMMAKIKGGADVKCYCTISSPFLTTKTSGGPAVVCLCNTSTSQAGLQNNH
ncbi:MAG: hypothetical protein JW731_06820 [Bacteroidales bacterium]|nr:hypothetical protein [Bacteroidales bacterium]